jgi:glycosidase
MFLLYQFSFVGAPQIWNGEELGMWGADDPDDRKPLWWPDMTFEPEATRAYYPRTLPPDSIRADQELTNYYRSLAHIRQKYPALSTGALRFLMADDERMCLVYSRTDETDEIIALFNRSSTTQTLRFDTSAKTYQDLLTGEKLNSKNGALAVEVKAISGRLLLVVK